MAVLQQCLAQQSGRCLAWISWGWEEEGTFLMCPKGKEISVTTVLEGGGNKAEYSKFHPLKVYTVQGYEK